MGGRGGPNGSGLRGPGSASEGVAEGGDELEGWAGVGGEGRLGQHPIFRGVDGHEDTTALPHGALDDAAVDEKKQHGDAAGQRCLGPVGREDEVVFQADAEAFRISELQYREGTIDIVSLLNNQLQLFSAQQTLVQVKLSRLHASNVLYAALGGGWEQKADDADYKNQLDWWPL